MRLRLLAVSCLLATQVWAEERLVIISPHWEGLRYEIARAFSDWHQQRFGNPVAVDWRDLGGANDDLRFVLSEFQQRPTGIGVDLFFGGGTDPHLEMAKRGLLAEYRQRLDILKAIPANIGGVPVYDPEYRLFGTALSSFGIIYNKRALAHSGWPELRTWQELAERAPIDSVASGDPRNSGSMHMMYEMILQRYGWDEGWRLITLLAGKIRAFDRNSSTSAKEVALGNAAYGLAIDFYAFIQITAAGAENVGFVLPADCVVINPDSVSMLRGAPHRAIAERFIEFCLSEDGQRLIFLPRGHAGGAKQFSIERMCVIPEFYERYRGVTLVPINPFAQRVSFRYDPQKGAARWDILNGLLGATIIDSHPEIVAAAKRGTLTGGVPVTEAEAMRLAAYEWKDPAARQRKLLEWQRWSHERLTEKH